MLIGGLINIAVLIVPLLGTTLANPVRHHGRTSHPAPLLVGGPTSTWLVVDAETGEALSESRADTHVYPASLSKMMTLYLTFQALNQDKFKLDQRLPVSVWAARQEPTKLWLEPGDAVSVRNLILAVITRSANDAAVVLAEAVAGSEAAFAQQMTETAQRLGMANTVYRNSSGLPDREQHTTARDLVRLALALYRDFPGEYDYFSTREFQFRGRKVTGHNHLLDWYRGTDGIKTGFTRASGFNLVTSVEREGRRLIGVVTGGSTWALRDKQMASLLDRGFAELASQEIDGGTDNLVAPAEDKPAGTIAQLAAHLSPVTKADAAPVARRGSHSAARQRAAANQCRVQLVPHLGQNRSCHGSHTTARSPVAKDKPVRVPPPVRHTRGGSR
jgi:D-alanyl-D-alanine carboxypeptidase